MKSSSVDFVSSIFSQPGNLQVVNCKIYNLESVNLQTQFLTHSLVLGLDFWLSWFVNLMVVANSNQQN